MRAVQLEEIHSKDKLESIITAADQAAEKAKEIIFSEGESANSRVIFIGFDDRKGWKLDAQNEYVKVHYKDFNGRRHFAAQTKVPISSEIGLNMNWEQVAKMAEWNENVKFSKLVGKIGDYTDLTHYASNEVFMVKSREFIVARKKVQVGNVSFVAATSCSTELVKSTGDAVMAVLHLGVGRYIPESRESPSHSRYDYVVSMDLKGMMPTYLVNQVMGKMVLSDVDNHRKNAEEFGKQNA